MNRVISFRESVDCLTRLTRLAQQQHHVSRMSYLGGTPCIYVIKGGTRASQIFLGVSGWGPVSRSFV